MTQQKNITNNQNADNPDEIISIDVKTPTTSNISITDKCTTLSSFCNFKCQTTIKQ